VVFRAFPLSRMLAPALRSPFPKPPLSMTPLGFLRCDLFPRSSLVFVLLIPRCPFDLFLKSVLLESCPNFPSLVFTPDAASAPPPTPFGPTPSRLFPRPAILPRGCVTFFFWRPFLGDFDRSYLPFSSFIVLPDPISFPRCKAERLP